jgi:hypothetical protein
VYIFRNVYKTAAALKREALLYVETLVSGYKTLRRHTAEDSTVNFVVQPAVHCTTTQNTASRCAYSTTAASVTAPALTNAGLQAVARLALNLPTGISEKRSNKPEAGEIAGVFYALLRHEGRATLVLRRKL